jgi:glutamine amidotransferase
MSRFRVAIIDYGAGNVQSVASSIARLGYAPVVTSSPAELARAQALVLPGVGAFGPAVARLRESGLDAAIREEVVGRRKPFLGICLGMQLLADSSDEDGEHQGLGLIPGRVEKLKPSLGLQVPHVGWNDLQIRHADPLFTRTGSPCHFYFDHSYHFRCAPEFQAATCRYGMEVTAAVQRENVLGVQFHPEKSQLTGLRLLRGFFVSTGAPAC